MQDFFCFLTGLFNRVIWIRDSWDSRFNWILYALAGFFFLYMFIDFVCSLFSSSVIEQKPSESNQLIKKQRQKKNEELHTKRHSINARVVTKGSIPSYHNRPLQLRGRIYVLSYFVSTSRQSWDINSTRQIKESISQAENWLIGQASNYGVKDLFFTNGYYGDCSDGYTTWRFHCPRYSDNYEYEHSFLQDLIREEGFASLDAFASWAKAKYQCRQCVVMCFVRTSGRCHAWMGATQFPIVFNYAWYPEGKQNLMPGTIAHELLHAIGGAVDLYRRKDYPKSKSDAALRLYPDSVMVDDIRPLSELTIDEVNAWRVGIGVKREPWFDWF